MADDTEAIAAIRTAPSHQRAEFWAEVRERIEGKPDPAVTSLIYYLRFGDRVKIGYTTNLPLRLKVIPHDEVLATEPGTMLDEKVRHARFAPLRIKGEWFRHEEPLTTHIAGLQ